MGASIKSEGSTITLSPIPDPLTPLTLRIPGNISSAAFWLVAGIIHPDARIRIVGAGTNPTRNGVIEVLQSMGASLKIENKRLTEPVADLLIESSSLKGLASGATSSPGY